MSFADRLQKRVPMGAAAVKPTKSALLSLCHPQVLMVGGHAQGLVNLELAPFVVGGLGALRLLDALDEVFCEFERGTAAGVEDPDVFAAELREAAALIHQHLASVGAASDQAHAEHEATHQHGGEPLQ